MPRLLIVHHTVSPPLQDLFESVRRGLDDAAGELGVDLEVYAKPALTCTAIDVLGADALILGTPANIGYMSGALKHFFDQIYYPCLEATVGKPFGYYIHGNDDTAGAQRAIERITTGLAWMLVRPPVLITGQITPADRDDCGDLAGLVVSAIADG